MLFLANLFKNLFSRLVSTSIASCCSLKCKHEILGIKNYFNNTFMITMLFFPLSKPKSDTLVSLFSPYCTYHDLVLSN